MFWDTNIAAVTSCENTLLKRELCVGTKKNWEGGRERGKIVILPKSTSTQIPNYKTSKKTHKQTTQ